MRQVEHPLDRPFRARGDTYRVTLLGRCRPDGIWEARIQFEPGGGGGVVLTTPVESTQSSEEALIRWASALGDVFLDGAFQRALASLGRKKKRRPIKEVPSSSAGVDLTAVERRVLECFRKSGQRTLNREAFFELIDDFSNADVVRAIESLERAGDVARLTDRGSAWVTLKDTPVRKPVRRRMRGQNKPELIYQHPHPIRDVYDAMVFGVKRTDGTWSGWIQFREPTTDRRLRTGQETSQADRDALEYWASGLEDLYLEGALGRAEDVKEN